MIARYIGNSKRTSSRIPTRLCANCAAPRLKLRHRPCMEQKQVEGRGQAGFRSCTSQAARGSTAASRCLERPWHHCPFVRPHWRTIAEREPRHQETLGCDLSGFPRIVSASVRGFEGVPQQFATPRRRCAWVGLRWKIQRLYSVAHGLRLTTSSG